MPTFQGAASKFYKSANLQNLLGFNYPKYKVRPICFILCIPLKLEKWEKYLPTSQGQHIENWLWFPADLASACQKTTSVPLNQRFYRQEISFSFNVRENNKNIH